MSGPSPLAYRKKASARVTVGEAQGLARVEAEKAVLVARWSVFLACFAIVLAGVALIVTVRR